MKWNGIEWANELNEMNEWMECNEMTWHEMNDECMNERMNGMHEWMKWNEWTN